MKSIFYVMGILTLLTTAQANGLCVWDEIPYEDSRGEAQFPFYNACDKAFEIHLCVKSAPSSGGEPKFSSYSGVIDPYSLLTLSGGNWDAMTNYRWNVGGDVECPFND